MTEIPTGNGNQLENASGVIKAKERKNQRFKSSLTTILSRQLTPDNIDFYAEDALVDLIKLTNSITGAYIKEEKPSCLTSTKELEDTAYAHFGLSGIEDILEHVASKALEIKKLEQVIERAEKMDNVIVPPEGEKPLVLEQNGTFEPKKIISRTKTLLFILSNDFEVDINDPDQLSIKTGVLSDGMMRKLSYYMLEIHGLSRTILCCDEEGNVTYVFDDSALRKHGISADDLTRLTKNDLNELIENDRAIGKRVVYSSSFVPKMISLIRDLKMDKNEDQDAGVYLYPKPPHGILSANGLARSLSTTQGVIARAIKSIGDELGETQQYRFKFAITNGYTPEQQEKILLYLEQRGYFAKKAPPDILSAKGLANALGFADNVVYRAVEQLGTSLGETTQYKFSSRVATGYTPDQQEVIRRFLENEGLFRDIAPEGVRSVSGMVKDLHLDNRSIIQTIKELGESLGRPVEYRIGNQATAGYTEEQQEMILQYLERRGYFAEKAPPGILSAKGISDDLRIADYVIVAAVRELGDSLGSSHQYRFSSILANGYTPEQQELIRKYLDDKGTLVDKAPQSVQTISGIAKSMDVGYRIVKNAVNELGDSLGKPSLHKFKTVIGEGYTVEQQEIIRQHLEAKGLLAKEAPQGVLSIWGIAKKLKMANVTLSKYVAEMDAILGEVNQYRFAGIVTNGYSPEQQEQIENYLVEKGLLVEKVPEGYMSARSFGEHIIGSRRLVDQAIRALGSSLGDTKRYRFGRSRGAIGYSPEQLAKIKQYIDENKVKKK